MPKAKAVAVASPDEWGPMMSAVDDQRRAFVCEMFLNGGNQTRAAMAVGVPKAAAKMRGHRWAHDPATQLAMTEHARSSLTTGVPKMMQVLAKLAVSKNPETSRKTAADWLSRAGLAPVARIESRVTVERTSEPEDDRVVLARIVRKMTDLGLDPRKILPPKYLQMLDAPVTTTDAIVEQPAAASGER